MSHQLSMIEPIGRVLLKNSIGTLVGSIHTNYDLKDSVNTISKLGYSVSQIHPEIADRIRSSQGGPSFQESFIGMAKNVLQLFHLIIPYTLTHSCMEDGGLQNLSLGTTQSKII